MAEAAAKKHEDNKCSLVDSGCASQLVEGLRTEEVSQSSSAVQAVCACLKSLTTADDPKPAASRCGCPVGPCIQCFASVFHLAATAPLHNPSVLVSLPVCLSSVARLSWLAVSEIHVCGYLCLHLISAKLIFAMDMLPCCRALQNSRCNTCNVVFAHIVSVCMLDMLSLVQCLSVGVTAGVTAATVTVRLFFTWSLHLVQSLSKQ